MATAGFKIITNGCTGKSASLEFARAMPLRKPATPIPSGTHIFSKREEISSINESTGMDVRKEYPAKRTSVPISNAPSGKSVIPICASARFLQHDCDQKHDRQNQKFAQIHGRDAHGKHIHLLYGASLELHVIDHAGGDHNAEQIQYHNHAIELGQQDIHWGQWQIQEGIFPHNEIDKCVGGSQDANGQQDGNHAGALFFSKFDCQTYGTKRGGGYIWHTTGSGKTLTSFKTARLASQLPYIDKVLFVVDRKDLDYQTMKEYDRFEKGAANSNSSTAVLKRQLEDPDARIIITTIQKLSTFIKKNPTHPVYQSHVVMIFDECHRSQFGDMHKAVVTHFKKYHLFGFTGTPIFAVNAPTGGKGGMKTTAQLFGGEPDEKGNPVRPLHTYTIVDAINDHNVLPFRVDYIKTMEQEPDIDDKAVWDIDREKAFMAPKRVELVTRYILDHFDQKTYRGQRFYRFNALTNITEVAGGKQDAVEEIKNARRLSGFNSIFAVASVDLAKRYYQEFQKQMAADPTKKLRMALIYSYGANEGEADGILDEENSEDTSGLDQSGRDFLDAAIRDYNKMFRTNYSTDGDKFQNYYKDVSLRMKNKELDLLIVVNMFLTGFDATTLNTLWVDKNLKMHGLIQAFSRTNRILNSVKTFGNIVCFRNLQKRVDAAISLFGDKNAGGIVQLRKFRDYYYGYTAADGKRKPGHVDMIEELTAKFPLSEPRIEGEQNQKAFIALFGAILRMRNLLSSFDEFAEKELLDERDLQDYLGRYQDLRDEWLQRSKGDKEDITDDIVFEVELIRQIEINIDYILMLVKKYHDSHCDDKEVLITIRRAVDASPELRSKKQLIENFIAGVNEVDDVVTEWNRYVSTEREKALEQLIQEEKLREPETRKFLQNAFRDGEIKTTGTDIDKLMPPVSRFGGGARAKKKQTVIEKLQKFFQQFFGIGGDEMKTENMGSQI